MVLRKWNEMVAAEFEKFRRGGLTRARLVALLRSGVRYLFETEVHAYAFSIAANAYLSFFPFNLIMLAICRRWLHWENAYLMVLQLLRVHLPTGSESVIRNLMIVVQGRPRLQLVSVFMLLFTSSGVFLPLEIALNKVWGFQRNRSFLKNQALSFTLVLVSGVLALCFILAITPVQAAITFLIGWIPSRGLLTKVSHGILEVASVPFVVLIYFMIYYFLPNGKVPVARVLPAAIATGILTEVGEVIYSLTLPMFRFREVYGPFALSVTLLFWAYVGALIMLFGAHLSAHGFVLNKATVVAPAPKNVQTTEV
ncbi:MAG TPA: YihY/virulence factor BrkB family protein [Terriglobia bacterium]|nr:YihY/virulence factor BrkB family protein [Terriglobia bacterium]